MNCAHSAKKTLNYIELHTEKIPTMQKGYKIKQTFPPVFFIRIMMTTKDKVKKTLKSIASLQNYICY